MRQIVSRVCGKTFSATESLTKIHANSKLAQIVFAQPNPTSPNIKWNMEQKCASGMSWTTALCSNLNWNSRELEKGWVQDLTGTPFGARPPA